jgi:hypothetical protein
VTGYRLGVDLGTTFTRRGGHHRTAASTSSSLGNRALQVPSVVYVMPDGAMLVGEAAERRGAGDPTRLVREFKRRVGDSVPIIVGGSPFSPQTLLSHLLRWVVGVATERQGGPPAAVTVTHPANWGAFKRDLLTQAVELADVPSRRSAASPRPPRSPTPSRNRVAPATGSRSTTSAAAPSTRPCCDATTTGRSGSSGRRRASSTSAASTSTRRCSGTSSARSATPRGVARRRTCRP